MNFFTSAAALEAATEIRKVPVSLADTIMSLFDGDPHDREMCERIITDKIAQIIESKTHCGVLLRVAEAAKQYAGPTTDCCMGGEATSELCELHQALAQWDHLTKPKEGQQQ